MSNKSFNQRRSIRLKDYDYSNLGAYSVTICTKNKECLFGEVVDGEMRLNELGEMVDKWWQKLPCKFYAIEIDEHIIMPNHFHGIVAIVGADPRVGPGAHTGAPLPKIIQWFKTMTTNEYIRFLKSTDDLTRPSKLW